MEITQIISDFIQMLVKYSPYYIEGIKNTVFLSLIGTLLGFILGVVLALARIQQSKNIFLKLSRMLSVLYIDIIRGTPLMVQLLIVYNLFDRDMRYMAGVIALSLNSAAYVSEIVRSGIQSIDKGQTEAARSLGMSTLMTYQEIIMPQAIKNILPALGNEFIVLIKETSIISVIGIMDVMRSVDTVMSKTFDPIPPLMAAMLIYLFLTMTLSKGLRTIERSMGQSNERE